MVENLADGHARIDANGLNGEHFQSPVAAETDVAKAGGNVHEQAQAADTGAAFDHGNVVVRLSAFGGAAQVELLRSENEAVFRDANSPSAIRSSHVEHDLLVRQQLVVQRESVAIRIEVRHVERIDDNVAAKVLIDFIA